MKMKKCIERLSFEMKLCERCANTVQFDEKKYSHKTYVKYARKFSKLILIHVVKAKCFSFYQFTCEEDNKYLTLKSV